MASYEIKNYHSADIISHASQQIMTEPQQFISTWQPADATNVILGFEIEIGRKGSKAADLFQLTVITQAALHKYLQQNDLFSGAGSIVMQRYDFNQLYRHITKIVSQCNAQTWEAACLYFAHYFVWEYHNQTHENIR